MIRLTSPGRRNQVSMRNSNEQKNTRNRIRIYAGRYLIFLMTTLTCPKPSDQPRDAARREECSQLDEESLTTFLFLNEEGERSDGDRLNEIMSF